MKELKILGLVIVFTLILYIGIEPFAHKYLHPHVAPANFNMQQGDEELANEYIAAAKKAIEKAQKDGDETALEAAQKELEKQENDLAFYKELWESANAVSALTGNAEKGKEYFEMSCIACHSLKADGYEPMMDDITASQSYGVSVPDLSNVGYIYDTSFLANLIRDPASAVKLKHKFNDDTIPFPMSSFYGLGEDELDNEIADIIAYLKSVAPKEMSDKEVFVDACVRCHSIKYANIYATSDAESLKNYMGMTPPDLSMMIRSRSADYLETFINDPQKNLPGTSMPRVGLTKDAQNQVVKYMEEVGDSKKSERQTFGIVLMLFFAAMAVVAYFWKKEVWKDLH